MTVIFWSLADLESRQKTRNMLMVMSEENNWFKIGMTGDYILLGTKGVFIILNN